jgi:hypothetical protein
MVNIVRMLHDPGSQLTDMLFNALRRGCICVVDVSQMRGTPAQILSGLILRRIFDHNQEEFIKAEPDTIPTIAVIEEAQSVLGNSVSEGPYVSWVKEGRKYDLGAVLITQQPGSISSELLSQGDNWFIFHLLSSGDLQAAKRANAHFSDDLLSSLLNEPLVGHGVFWSSVSGRSYPIPIRALSFEGMYAAVDQGYSREAVETPALNIRTRFAEQLRVAQAALPVTQTDPPVADDGTSPVADEPVDARAAYAASAIATLKTNQKLLEDIRSRGVTWRAVVAALEEALPDVLEGRNDFAYKLVPAALDEIFGPQNTGWRTERRQKVSGSGQTTWVVASRT